jgi:putative membrane protein
MWNTVTSVVLALLVLVYCAGLSRLWRAPAGRRTVPLWRAFSFLAGCGAAAGALLSVLDRWSDITFSAHMTQHEILMLVAAPLMVLGRPFVVALWALRRTRDAAPGAFTVESLIHRAGETRLWLSLSSPLAVLLLHAVVLWFWHVPALFEAALAHETIHVVQHLCFFLTAALFWWALLHGRYGRSGYGVGVLYVFATAMHTEILGALLAFTSRIWYPTHAARTAAHGMHPAKDQQLAGVIMWVPFGVIFVIVALALFAAWLGEAEKRVAFTTAERGRGDAA